MNIKGIIFESLSKTIDGGKTPVLCKDNRYYLESDGEIRSIYQYPGEVYTSMASDNGVWISDKSLNSTIYIDMFDQGYNFNPIPSALSKLYVYDKNILAITSGDFVEPDFEFKQELLLIDENSKIISKKSFSGNLNVTLDENHIYIRSGTKQLIECYDYQLEKIWEYEKFSGRVYLDFERKPQIHNNLLIINHARETIALDKETGKEIWKRTFDAIPSSNILAQEKIYTVCEAQLYLIDPNTGEVEKTVDTGYPKMDDQGMDKNRIGVFPVGDYLYAIAMFHDGNPIKLFNKDASELLSECTYHDYYLNPALSIQPTIKGNKIFHTVRNANAYSETGVMVLEIDNASEQLDVYPVPRPAAKVIASPSLKVSHKLQIYLDSCDIEEVLRYGDLLISEVQYATGYIPLYNIRENALDSKHNGLIELFIDSEIAANSQNNLLDFEEKLREKYSDASYLAGDKITSIDIKLIVQPKSEWKYIGDALDWPTIREQETPLI